MSDWRNTQEVVQSLLNQNNCLLPTSIISTVMGDHYHPHWDFESRESPQRNTKIPQLSLYWATAVEIHMQMHWSEHDSSTM